MTKQHLKILQNAADSKTESLAKETERLEKAYNHLKQEFKAVNLELEESNEVLHSITYYLHSILGHISQGILFIDFNGCVTTYNPSAEKILEKPSEQVLFYDFWANFADEIFGFSMRKALVARESASTTHVMITEKEIEIETKIVDGKGPLQGMIVLIRDITEIRHLQTIANRNDKLKELGEMAAMVAHELRNPLGGIKGFASLLQRDLQDRPDLQKMAAYIIQGTDSLGHLITTFLHYARPLKPEIEWVDLGVLLEDLCNHLKADATLSRPNIKIDITTNDQKIIAPIDRILMRSALLNLMINSIQAMPEGGTLTLSISASHYTASITIADTGIGIPLENRDKLFTPFFTTRDNGSGFGLAEVLKIVQVHGAAINVDSTVGKGSAFTIKIPLKRKDKQWS